MNPFLGYWEVHAPAGLTDTGRQQRFYAKTLTRMQERANAIGNQTFSRLKIIVESTYQEGSGVTKESLQFSGAQRTPRGITMEYTGGGRAIVFLTALAGLPYASPGHYIPQSGRSRFYWKNPLHGLPPGFYAFPSRNGPAFWQPRQHRGDVISNTLGAGAQQFTQAMIAENNRAVVEFVQNDLSVYTRSPRVNVAAGSGIAPLE